MAALSTSVLDLPVAPALAEHSTYSIPRPSVGAWLAAYHPAQWLGLSERIAIVQANAACDRATEPQRWPLDEAPCRALTEAGGQACP